MLAKLIHQCSSLLVLATCLGGAGIAWAEPDAPLQVDVSGLEGVDLSPENAYEFRVTNPTGAEKTVELNGLLQYRGGRLRASWKLKTTLRPGLNVFTKASLPGAPVWQFSEDRFRELFMDSRRLPPGTYEYCVTVRPAVVNGKPVPAGESDGCVHNSVEEELSTASQRIVSAP